MKKAKIPTIIGIIILIISLATGVILVQNQQLFRLGAEGQNSPKDVRISNITPDSFSVTWITDIQNAGYVKYGTSVGSITNTKTEGSASPEYTHLVNISGLNAQTDYFFKINSGGNDFDNNGVAWQGQTESAAEPGQAVLISGSVLLSTGASAKNAVVYVTAGSKLFSALTSQNGSWIISLPPSIDTANSLLEISVLSGQGEVSTAQIYTKSAKPVPAMILGQTHDFKNLPTSGGTDIPQASLGVPDASTPSSGFNIPESTSTPSASTVTLKSITNNEVVTSVKPEFFGEGPKGTKIQITVESDPITESVTIPTSGEWNWDIPKNLPEGPHTITITWKDANGILRTLTRNFVVQASEGPAFVSTPSATPKVTPSASPSGTPKATTTPRLTATPSATLRASPSGTPFPQPVSGSLTPTVLLSIMGISLIAFSFLLWKKSHA
jgi:hypothetical protein